MLLMLINKKIFHLELQLDMHNEKYSIIDIHSGLIIGGINTDDIVEVVEMERDVDT